MILERHSDLCFYKDSLLIYSFFFIYIFSQTLAGCDFPGSGWRPGAERKAWDGDERPALQLLGEMGCCSSEGSAISKTFCRIEGASLPKDRQGKVRELGTFPCTQTRI